MAALAAQGDALWPLLAFVAIVALNLAKWLLYRSKVRVESVSVFRSHRRAPAADAQSRLDAPPPPKKKKNRTRPPPSRRA